MPCGAAAAPGGRRRAGVAAGCGLLVELVGGRGARAQPRCRQAAPGAAQPRVKVLRHRRAAHQLARRRRRQLAVEDHQVPAHAAAAAGISLAPAAAASSSGRAGGSLPAAGPAWQPARRLGRPSAPPAPPSPVLPGGALLHDVLGVGLDDHCASGQGRARARLGAARPGGPGGPGRRRASGGRPAPRGALRRTFAERQRAVARQLLRGDHLQRAARGQPLEPCRRSLPPSAAIGRSDPPTPFSMALLSTRSAASCAACCSLVSLGALGAIALLLLLAGWLAPHRRPSSWQWVCAREGGDRGPGWGAGMGGLRFAATRCKSANG